jgi:hypothetical protein
LRAQWRRPKSELSCSSSSTAAARPRRRGRHFEDREGDVQAATQVDVAIDVLQARVARRAQALDEAALEQQRAEL